MSPAKSKINTKLSIYSIYAGFLGMCTVSASGQTPIPLTDAAKVIQSQAPTPMAYLEKITDPRYGISIQKVTDSVALGVKGPVPIYSQLQAWNANQTMVLVKTGDILDAKSWKKVHKVDYGWPGFGNGLRWSPIEANTLFFTGGLEAGQTDEFASQCKAGFGRLMRYRLQAPLSQSGKRELVHCFEEYNSLLRDPSFEELSEDGRYVALVGRRPDGVNEAFAYDIEARVKFAALELPKDASGTPRSPDWAGMSPSGKYVLCMWGKGPERFKGLEAYDRETMKYAGKVTTSSGHGDLVMDEDGKEYYVYTNGNNAVFLTGNHYIVRSQIPSGVVYNGDNPDPTATVNSGASVAMVAIDWYHGVHVSCRGTLSPVKGCVVSTINGSENGQQPFEKEIFFVHLESQSNNPKVERLAQHNSDVEFAKSLPDADCPSTSYWVQPHATLSPDGRSVLFGSSWGQSCSVESYLLDLSSIRPSVSLKSKKPRQGRRGMGVVGGGVRWAAKSAQQYEVFDGDGKKRVIDGISSAGIYFYRNVLPSTHAGSEPTDLFLH
jgi:hypothetical protein